VATRAETLLRLFHPNLGIRPFHVHMTGAFKVGLLSALLLLHCHPVSHLTETNDVNYRLKHTLADGEERWQVDRVLRV